MLKAILVIMALLGSQPLLARTYDVMDSCQDDIRDRPLNNPYNSLKISCQFAEDEDVKKKISQAKQTLDVAKMQVTRKYLNAHVDFALLDDTVHIRVFVKARKGFAPDFAIIRIQVFDPEQPSDLLFSMETPKEDPVGKGSTAVTMENQWQNTPNNFNKTWVALMNLEKAWLECRCKVSDDPARPGSSPPKR